MRKSKLTNKEIIEQLQKCYKENGAISQNIYSKSGFKPSVDAISSHFGSWNQSLVAAGLTPYKRREKKDIKKSASFTDECIIKQLQKCYEENGSVSMKTYDKGKYKPGRTLITNQFGTWNAALEAAGLKSIKNHERVYSDEEVFQTLREFYEENDGNISFVKYEKSGKTPKLGTLIKYYGSWNKTLEKFGITPNDSNIELFTKEEIINILKKFYHDNGQYISSTLYTESKQRPGVNVIQKKFGSWNQALIEAGIPINRKSNRLYSKEEIIKKLKKFYEKHGKVTRDLYFDSKEIPHLHTIIHYFGTWEEALVAANIPVSSRSKEFTKAEALDKIRKIYNDNDDSISVTIYRESGEEPTVTTIRRLFGSWENAVEEANLSNYRTSYSKEEIKEILIEASTKVKGKLTIKKYKELGLKPSTLYITKKFQGSWENALVEASLIEKEKEYSDEEIFETLRKIRDDNEGKISVALYKVSGAKPSFGVLVNRFGNWNNVLIEAGI